MAQGDETAALGWLGHGNPTERPLWRYIPPLAAAGRVQMAIDRWLLEECAAGRLVGALRFYSWSPPALSLGYHQRSFPPAWRGLRWGGEPVDLVRRPTGGRAVLHQGDLTYAVVGSGFAAARSQAYREICQFLIAGFAELGLDLRYGEAQAGTARNVHNCFALATGADLVLPDGTKLVGSAQVVQRRVVLQHGSIALAVDPALFQRVFHGEAPPARSRPLGDRPLQDQRDYLTEKLTAAAERCFGVTLRYQPLTAIEWAQVRSLEPASHVEDRL